jgi:RNA polymerase sigma-70 factor (ECF subfamily)
MNEFADRLPGALVTDEDTLTREFEARLTDSSTLAFRVAFSVLRHRQDAEDIAQDALARAFSKMRQLRDRERFRAWLVRLTWRLALDHRRGDRRRAAREERAPAVSAGGTTVDELIARDRAERLWRAIDALPDKLRLVVVLASIEEHHIDDVAALVGAPVGTVKSRLFQARKKLQELLR